MKNYEKVIIGKNKAAAAEGALGIDYYIASRSMGAADNHTLAYITADGLVIRPTSPFTQTTTHALTVIDLKNGDLLLDAGQAYNASYTFKERSFFAASDTSLSYYQYNPGDAYSNPIIKETLDFSSYSTSAELVCTMGSIGKFDAIKDGKYLAIYPFSNTTTPYASVIDTETNTLLWSKKINIPNADVRAGNISEAGEDPFIYVPYTYGRVLAIDIKTGNITEAYQVAGSAQADYGMLTKFSDTRYGYVTKAVPGKFGSSFNYNFMDFDTNTVLSSFTSISTIPYVQPSLELDPTLDYLLGYSNDGQIIKINKSSPTVLNSFKITINTYEAGYLHTSKARAFTDGVLISGSQSSPDVTQKNTIEAFIPHDTIPTGTFGPFTITNTAINSLAPAATVTAITPPTTTTVSNPFGYSYPYSATTSPSSFSAYPNHPTTPTSKVLL